MENRQKLYKKIRRVEVEVLTAPPARAAKIAVKLNKWKAEVFD